MKYEVVIWPEAEEDLREAKAWYERCREGLGDEFLSCIEETIESIRCTPFLYGVVYKDVRRALVRRFPYGIFYRVAKDRVVVLAVFHASRDPRSWQRRV